MKAALQIAEDSVSAAEQRQAKLRPLTVVDFLSQEIPFRSLILAPWLPSKGLAMLVAPRGIGKTLFGLSVAYAIACGESLLGFKAEEPRRVLYIDGEMPARPMQERVAAVVQAFDKEPPEDDYFRFLLADLTEDGLPDLSTLDGQAEIDAQIGDADLIVLDNLSTLVRGGKENEAESWGPVQEWVLRHRRQGHSILMIHHTGKNGQQRGTSKREDVLDTIISLKRPADYTADQGARFEVHFEKARGFYGDDAQPFEAQYELRDGKATWTRKSIDDVELIKVVEAIKGGSSVRDTAKEHGLSKSKVQRLKDKAVAEGMLNAN
jgi:putative DNA primase/helicase